MSKGLSTTFQLLAKTPNEAAVQVLLPALDSPDAAVRESALTAVLKRRSPKGHWKVLGRLHDLTDRDVEIIRDNPGRMTATLRDAVLGTEEQKCVNACQAVIWFREYDLIAALITAAEDTSNPNATLAAQTLLQLAELLYRELSSDHAELRRRDPQRVREHVVSSLERSFARFNEHKQTEILEAFLLLAGRDNPVLKRVLSDPRHNAYLSVIDVLQRSKRIGVIRLLLNFLEDPDAPTAATGVIANRQDLRFLKYLMGKIGVEPSTTAARNLKRIKSFAWVRDNLSTVDHLDDAQQRSSVVMLLASGMKRLEAFEALRYLVQHGRVGGRIAAVAALTEFNDDQASQLTIEALDDPDPEVQATALVHLRDRGIPGAMSRAIAALNSPHAVIVQAARDSLSEFHFDRFLRSYELLDDESRLTTGQLVARVDPQSIPALADELASLSRTRRLRAIGMSTAMGLVPQFENQLIELIDDDDHMIRREAALALGDHESPAVRAALATALTDQSASVQDAAAESLQRINASPAAAPHVGSNHAEEGRA